ncbi:hypothetical protein CALCODRAFT_541484, partial [Calocera cornea HHB12733]
MPTVTTFRAFYPLLSEPSSTGAWRFGPPQNDISFLSGSISIGPVPPPSPAGDMLPVPDPQSHTRPVAPASTTASSDPKAPPRILIMLAASSGARGWFARQAAAAIPASTLLPPPPPATSGKQVKQSSKKRVSQGDDDYVPDSEDDKSRKKARDSKVTVPDASTSSIHATTAISSIHDPPAPIPPLKGGYKLNCFCDEVKETIQDAKILFRL